MHGFPRLPEKMSEHGAFEYMHAAKESNCTTFSTVRETILVLPAGAAKSTQHT